MSESEHDLASEFPQFKSAIHALKSSDAHFRKLFEHYHEVNKSIHRAEQRVEAMTEQHEEELRKKRLQLKDQLYSILSKHGADKK